MELVIEVDKQHPPSYLTQHAQAEIPQGRPKRRRSQRADPKHLERRHSRNQKQLSSRSLFLFPRLPILWQQLQDDCMPKTVFQGLPIKQRIIRQVR
jgi:hypothetical protein